MIQRNSSSIAEMLLFILHSAIQVINTHDLELYYLRCDCLILASLDIDKWDFLELKLVNKLMLWRDFMY